MRTLLFIAILIAPEVSYCQLAAIASKKYSWIAPTNASEKNMASVVLFEGSAHDMEFVQMTANAISPSQEKTSMEVPKNEEHLLLIRTGSVDIGMEDSVWSLGQGSIALLIPGEKYSVQNMTSDACTFYVMKYRCRLPIVRTGRSFVKDWNKVPFKAHDKGGIRNYFDLSTPMTKRFEMHVTTLKEGLKSHEPHTHRAEEIVLVINNKTEMQIGEKFYKGGSGDIYYLGSNVPHAIRNDGSGTCTYFAFQFE